MTSKQPRKQRILRYQARPHTLLKFMHAHLSPELREKYGRRSLGLRSGDTVKVVKGVFKGVEGKVKRVDVRRVMVYVENVTRKKADGSAVDVPLRVPNVMIMQLNLDDKYRKEKLEAGKK